VADPPLVNLIDINVNDWLAAVQSGSEGAIADASRNRLIGNDDVHHGSDARWLAIVDVKFRLGPTVSTVKMIKIAGH
jgi:hypothetical protein